MYHSTEMSWASKQCSAWAMLGLLLSFPTATGAQRYTFANYGLESGLANVNSTALLESRSGTIWVGTQKGIFKANGPRFEEQLNFANAGMESPWAMAEDNEGRIWTVDGSHLVFWKDGIVHAVPEIRHHLLSVSGTSLISVSGQPDTIYLLHDGQLQRIASPDHGKSWQALEAFTPALLQHDPDLRQLTSAVAGTGSTVWAGCGKAICEIDLALQTAKQFGPREGAPADSWMNFLLTRSGEVWARGGLSIVRIAKGANQFSPVSGVPKGRYLVTSSPDLLEDRDGRVVINVAEGILRTDGTNWQILDRRNGLPQDEIEMMIFDHTGTLWLSPSGRGIARWLGYGNWEGWTREDGLSSSIVLSISEDRTGRKWIATDAGLDALDAGSSHIRNLKDLSLHHLASVVSLRGHVWTGDSFGSVIDFDPATGRTRVALDKIGTVYQMIADREDRIWICSPEGLYYFAPGDKWSKPHHIDQPLLPKGNAYGITEGVPGVLWAMTQTGMSRFDGVTWSAVELPVKKGPWYTLMTAAAADGTLWIQTRHPAKILHLKVEGQSTSILSEFSDPIMQSENLGFMAMDQRGWLWIESDRGLHIYNGRRWVRSNSQDGLLYDNPDYPAFLADSDGSVWIGTSGGLSHIQHPEAIFDVPRPTVDFADLRLGDSTVPRGVQGKFDLRRPPLSVRLDSTDYSRAGAVVYRYHLEGLENAWQETDESSFRFPALDPGTYTLRVAAFDRRLHESSEEHAVSFTVLEPWWNRAWFQLVEGVFGGLLTLVLWRLSVRLLVMRQRELEAVVATRTAELEREKAELLTARSALIEMTRRDNLTGLLNRAAIFECMNALCEISLATGSPLAIVMADIDHFKRINDEYGHVVGDVAIRECADRIARTIRPHDFVGRYGGEELLILMPGLDPASSTARLEELRTAIAGEPIHRGSVEVRVTCSFGVAWMGHQRCALESLVNTADEALYRAKRNGRNRVEFAPNNMVAMH